MSLPRKLILTTISAIFLLSFFPSGPKEKIKFIDPKNMDFSIRPGDNFFLYANGNWLRHNAVPLSKTRWGSFDQLIENNNERLHILLEDASKSSTIDEKYKKIGDFYLSGMDSIEVDHLGYDPIRTDLLRIASIKTIPEVFREIAAERMNGSSVSLLQIFIGQDRRNSTQYIPQIGQGGLSLPDRDYYIKNDSRSSNIRKQFLVHLSKMFRLAGVAEGESYSNAEIIMRIETALAKAQSTRVEMRDVNKSYNKFSWKDLTLVTPLIDWKAFASSMMIQGVDSIVVANPGFLKSVDLLMGALPVSDWRTYLQWHLIESSAPYMSSAFVKETFNFNQVLTGQKERTPRWQRVSNQIDNSLGDLIGELYVNKYFTAEAKKRMLDLVNNLQKTFSERIKRLDWMSEATKERALEKLSAFTTKIGYTDKWRDYSSVIIDKHDYFGNHQRAARWAFMENVNRLGKPIDKTRWGFTPPTVNASYNSTNNEITFPAGILQFPFFDFAADDAVNYGGIGCVIGHEMTHGFDDQGRQSGPDGNLSDWWTKEDADKFKSKADDLANQYNAFPIQDSLRINGKLTLGENLADLGGLNIAYEAFSKTNQFRDGKNIDGFTPQQRFFLAFAQIWRGNSLQQEEAQRLLTDVHSPGIARTNIPLSNIDAWYEAFNVKAGDKMFKPKDKRIRIW